MDQRKVDFISRQVEYGRGQGLKAGILAFVAFSLVLGIGMATDPFGYYQERTIQASECILNPSWMDEPVTCRDRTFTQVYLNMPALFAYFWLAVMAFVITLSMLALVCYPKQFEEQLGRNMTIFGEKQVFPDFDEEKESD